MNGLLFSCVVPVKGDSAFFKEALASLESQGMGNQLEIIVQDGGTDSGDVCESVCGGVGSLGASKDVRYYREDDNGQSDALNKGFAKAKGEWLFWLNADDVLLPGTLRKVQQLITRNSQLTTLNWIVGDIVYINRDGDILEVRTDAKWLPWYGRYLRVWTGGPSSFFNRGLWERIGGLDTDLKYVMDIDLWTRWTRAGVKFVSLDDYIWGFRVHDGSKTASGRNKQAHYVERLNMLAKYGLTHQTFWRNVTRVASVLDGSWAKRKIDTCRFRGKHWSEIE